AAAPVRACVVACGAPAHDGCFSGGLPLVRKGKVPAWATHAAPALAPRWSYPIRQEEFMLKELKPVTLGVIVGNRGFFPKHLCVTGRETILKVLEEEGIRAVIVGAEETPYGSIGTMEDARKCADL